MKRNPSFRFFMLLVTLFLSVTLFSCSGEQIIEDSSSAPSGNSMIAFGIENETEWLDETDEESTPAADDSQLEEEVLEPSGEFDVANIPDYSGKAYVEVNGNVPYFISSELKDTSYEYYSELDSLGRCGVCTASVGQDIMPTENRGSISSVKPTGWKNVQYAGVVDGGYLYNRCHLIGYQLTAENANKQNLITGTRYLNVTGMLPFENMVADYVQETNNHVLYRVTPVFEGNNLVAKGVLMEAESVEDEGEGILYCVFCYNVQPGVEINYADGSSQLADGDDSNREQDGSVSSEDEEMVWISKNGSKYHSNSSCSNIENPTHMTKSQAESLGYEPCKRCY